MNLPSLERAVVEQTKVVDYLLAFDHSEGASKAEFFGRFGFTVEEWHVLANALLIHARTNTVSSVSPSKFGTKYRIDGRISCPDGRAPPIRAVWIIDEGSNVPRLVTAFPL